MKTLNCQKIPMPSEKRVLMTPPFTYYGGKQNMLKYILPKIPEHLLYCEPFCGGASVFFAKDPAKIEVLNDTNGELVNFYKIVKTKFGELRALILSTLHSRRAYNDALVVYHNPHLFDEVRRAWAIWVSANMSFGGSLGSGYAYERSGSCRVVKMSNKRACFIEKYAVRLENCQMEEADAIHVIKTRDAPHSFFYVDPPYFNANMGHYDGYTHDDFEQLLLALEGIRGRFLLSSYDSDLLKRYVDKNRWKQERRSFLIFASMGKRDKRKEEVLTWAEREDVD